VLLCPIYILTGFQATLGLESRPNDCALMMPWSGMSGVSSVADEMFHSFAA
jgi:hypothetical protein